MGSVMALSAMLSVLWALVHSPLVWVPVLIGLITWTGVQIGVRIGR